MWLSHVNKLIISYDVRVDELSALSWTNIQNPENFLRIQNLFKYLEYEN